MESACIRVDLDAPHNGGNTAAHVRHIRILGGPGVNCGVSDAAGQYSCSVPRTYAGSITPVLSGYSFSPASLSYNNPSGNLTNQNYTASAGGPTTHTLTGTVSTNGAPLAGATLSGSGATCGASNASGQYTCVVPQGYTGSITPSLGGYHFSRPPAAPTAT